MRQEPEFFGEDEVELVQVSRRMRDATKVEALLTEAGIDYAVGAELYAARILFVFPTERYGAFFYVRPERAEKAREVLRAKGIQVTEVEP